MRRRFFWRNLLVFLTPVLFAIMVLGGTLFAVTSDYARQQAQGIATGMLQQSRASLESILGEIDSLNTVFSNHSQFGFRLKRFLSKADQGVTLEDYDTVNNANQVLQSIANANQYLQSIYAYYDGSQCFLVSSARIASLAHYQDTEWYDSFKAQSADTPMWLEKRSIRAYPDDTNPVPVLTIYRRISAYGKQNVGLMVYNIKISTINRLLSGMKNDPDTYLLVTDEQGRIVFTSDEAKAARFDDNVGTLLTLPVNAGGQRAAIESVSVIVYHQYSDYFGLRYLLLQDARVASELPMTTLKMLVLVLSACVIVGVLASIYSARQNTRKLYDIINLMECASSARPLPAVQRDTRDLYGYILKNILHAFLEQDRMRTQLNQRKYEIQLLGMQALHNQINPHFLYNTLQTVYWNVIGANGIPNESSEMIAALTEILKYALGSAASSVPLSEEIRIAQSYLEIQAVRFPGQFNVFWQIDPETSDAQVIRMLLQPLLENCLEHGINSATPQIDISVASRAEEGRLLLSVTDNGAGFTPERLAEIRQTMESSVSWKKRHIGLMNTHKRLRLTFGEDYGVRIESQSGKSTQITLVLPLLDEPFDAQIPWENGALSAAAHSE